VVRAVLELAVDFCWERPVSGDGITLTTVRNASGEEVRLLAARARFPFERYEPLREETGLFLTFAETEQEREPLVSDEGLLAFANHYGFLGGRESGVYVQGPELVPGLDPKRVERLSAWNFAVVRMWAAVALWRAAQTGDTEALAKLVRWSDDGKAVFYRGPSWVTRQDAEEVEIASFRDNREVFTSLHAGDLAKPALVQVVKIINAYGGLSDVSGFATWETARGRPGVRFGTTSLLTAMWLQFALAVEYDKQYRRCRECGKWFELTPGVNRTSRQTCSNACRNRGYQRRQEDARRMHAEGKTLNQIAKELDTDVKTVKGWVTGRKGR
jgi:hypothetical protein